MKILYISLLIPFIGFSQTPAERQKIVQTYDQVQVNALKEKSKEYMAQQKLLIDDFRRNNPSVIENERHSLQRIYNGIPHYFTTYNAGSSATIRTNAMYPGGSLGLDITGAGIAAGVWDGGKVRNTHNEFSGRVTLLDDATELSDHATHVTGTVIAAGLNPARRGIAYGADAYTSDWNSDNSEMVEFGAGGYLVSNHSYGYQTEDLPLWKFGQYDGGSIEIDELAVTFPYYQIVIAAGNDRNSGIGQDFTEGGYDLLSGTACSKNGITVAAVEELLDYSDPSNVLMSSFSNFGPVDDGRIKPDISAKGVGVNSTISTSNSAFSIFNGTSMAAPAITGMIVLLQKHYSGLYTDYMRASTVRGLICHTAREAGFNPGPDYEFGWGLADGLTSAAIITGKDVTSVIEENVLANGQTFTKTIAITEPQQVMATICWTDPVGNANAGGANDNRVARLKNNLDLKILKDGNVYYPWKLFADDPFQPASRDSDNEVDNVEKVEIDFADPGVYTIQVTHKGTLSNPQTFSLIANGSVALSLATDNPNFADNIVLYPNPVKNMLNFSIPQNGEASNLMVYDILGKKIGMNLIPVNNSVDVSALSGGIYFAQFEVDGKIVTRKFIKE